MTIILLLILAPYGAFALLMLITSAAVSLWAAAAICLAVIVLDVARGRSIKILGVGSVITFAAAGCYVSLIDPTLTTWAVRFAVDTGIFLVSLLSIAIRRPFALQYAREVIDPETIAMPGFIGVNYSITWTWTAAMLLMMAGDITMIYLPSLPLWSGLLIAFAARNSAVYFTKWYPRYRKAKYVSLSDSFTRSSLNQA